MHFPLSRGGAGYVSLCFCFEAATGPEAAQTAQGGEDMPSSQVRRRLVTTVHCRANMARIRQSMPEFGLDFQAKVFDTF